MNFSSLMIDDVVEDRSSIVSTKTFSYSRLPSEPFTLSVLKLDGSCFHVEVAETATVADLNRAVEAVFSHIPQRAKVTYLRNGQGKYRGHMFGSNFAYAMKDASLSLKQLILEIMASRMVTSFVSYAVYLILAVFKERGQRKELLF